MQHGAIEGVRFRGSVILIAAGLFMAAGCRSGDPRPTVAAPAQRPTVAAHPDIPFDLIPRPVTVTAGPAGEAFVLGPDTIIVAPADDPAVNAIAEDLGALLRRATGYSLPVTPVVVGAPDRPGALTLKLDPSLTHPEGYHLHVRSTGIEARAATAHGLFNAAQTLRQLLPATIESPTPIAGQRWLVPGVQIEDAPRFAYRGVHLDVGRHFQPVQFVERFIDLIALYKFNTFHFHLTEDQGWRIEIKKYPRLTEVGAWRKQTLIGHLSKTPPKFDGTPHGGFYTQDEIRRIVAYAARRFITVIPEIEMPGHSTAALAAYPGLGCTPGPFAVSETWGVHEEVYCPSEATFSFLDDVLAEVVELFPSRYIHIGGDEAEKIRWKASPVAQEVMRREGLKDEFELQSYFIRRAEKMLAARGRRLIGWDEILEGGLAPGATVMSWRGVKGGIAAARQGHDVIMAPDSHTYFDHYQAEPPESEPLAIGGFLPLEKVYQFEPVPAELSAAEAKHVIGAQGNLWTEYVATPAAAEYMAFPRALALAEVVWSPKEARDLGGFVYRLRRHLPRLDHRAVNYARHVLKAP